MNDRPKPIKAVPVRHPWRWLAAGLIVVLIANAVWSLATRARFDWAVFGQYVFSAPIMHGLVNTLMLTAVAMIMGVVLGVLLAVMWLSPNPLVSGASWFYIWLFRGTPVLVQLFFWYFLAAVYPHVSIAVPFGGPELLGAATKDLIPLVVAVIFGLGFNEGAYMAEIVRAGINSVDYGQEEAAKALGLSRLRTLRHIVLPQAMRVIIPPTGNETISMLKTSALASVLAFTDLFYAAQTVYDRIYKTIELLAVASAWYLVFTTVLTIGQFYLERYFARGSSRQPPASRLEYVVRNVFKLRSPREEGSLLPEKPRAPGEGRA